MLESARQLPSTRLLRYVVSGVMAALVYAAATAALNSMIGLDLGLAGAIGYVIAMPCAYLLHRKFSFGSAHSIRSELPRFIVQSLVSIALAGVIPSALVAAGTQLALALAATSIAVPLFNYAVLSTWVFGVRR